MTDTQIQIFITILTGLFSIIPTIFESNKASKLKYITAERAQWRKEMRDITSELKNHEENSSTVNDILSKYKTRLNAYGKGIDNDYLKDSHIWRVITLLEKDNTNDELKNDLVYYVSLLLKHDWERAKDEVSYNGKGLISNCLYIITNLLFVYFAYSIFDSKISDTIVSLLLFALIYFVPNVMKTVFRLINVKGAISNTLISYFISILFYICYFASPDIKQFGLLNIPVLLQLVSLLINGISDLEKAKKEYEYIKAIKNYDFSISKNSEFYHNNIVSKANNSKKVKKVKKENNKKVYNEHYSIFKKVSAPFCILYQGIVYIISIVRYISKIIVSKEYELINKIKSKNDDLKNLYK